MIFLSRFFIFHVIIPFFLILIFVGLVFLQNKLSKHNEKYWGMILPITSFILSIIIVIIFIYKNKFNSFISLFISATAMTLICNITTAAFFAIYYIQRNSTKKSLKK